MFARARRWTRWLLGPKLPPEGVTQPLILCPGCGQRVVVPVAWQEDGEERWWIALRCGECGLAREVMAGEEQMRRYGRELDAGAAEIAAELARLERERMAAAARSFAEALARDLIDVTDFER
jgi:hypothetical protein